MKIFIKSHFSASILFEFEAEDNSIKSTVEAAVKTRANLHGADLHGADLHGADLHGADLRGVNFEGADLEGANFRSANLYGANLRSVDLRGADLEGVNLEAANLYGADLRSVNFRSANFRSANLHGANLHGADLRGVNFEGADLEGELLSKAPLQLNNLKWPVLISEAYLRIGCQRFTIEDWRNFSDERIAKMDSDALKFWRQWKAPIIALCDARNLGNLDSEE